MQSEEENYDDLPNDLVLCLIKLRLEFSKRNCFCCLKEKDENVKLTVGVRDKDGDVTMYPTTYVVFFLCVNCEYSFRSSFAHDERDKMETFLSILAKRFLSKIPKTFDKVNFCYFLNFSHAQEIEEKLNRSPYTSQLLRLPKK